MAPLDSLPGDQRAVLQLVLGRGRSYDAIARLLSINPESVRERARQAMDALGPETRLTEDARQMICDYLLEQLPEADVATVRDRLAHSAGDRGWARVLSEQLAPLTSHPLPDIPLDTAPATSQPPASATDALVSPPPAAAAAGDDVPPPVESVPAALVTDDATPTDDSGRRRRFGRRQRPAAEPDVTAPPVPAPDPEEPGGGDDDTPRSSRRGGMIVIALAVIIVVVVIVIIAKGHGSNNTPAATASVPTPTGTATAPISSTTSAAASGSATSTTASSTSTTTTSSSGGGSATTKPVSQINLTPPGAGSKAAGIAEVLRQNSTLEVAIVGQNVPANTTSPANAYEVWLYNSPSDAKSLGFVNPGVTSSGKLSAAGPLPSNYKHYKELIITTETTAQPKTPGPILLQGQLAATS